jgi:hypothetical protein
MNTKNRKNKLKNFFFFKLESINIKIIIKSKFINSLVKKKRMRAKILKAMKIIRIVKKKKKICLEAEWKAHRGHFIQM